MSRAESDMTLVRQVLLIGAVERVECRCLLRADELGHTVEGVNERLLDPRCFSSRETHDQEHEPVLCHANDWLRLSVR